MSASYAYEPSEDDASFAKKHLNDLDLRGAPKAINSAIRELLEATANRDKIVLAVEKPVVTTSEAAQMLCVSRSFLVKLLDQGKIPFHRLEGSSHRRLYRADLLSFMDQQRQKAEQALQSLVDESEGLELYDS